MKEKGFLRKLMSKAGTGLLFVAACFAAVFILVEFHGNYVLVGVAALLLLISAYLFLNTLFEEKSKEWSKLGDEEDPRKLHGNEDSEEGLRTIKYMKEMVSELKKQNELLENLENEIYMLSEKQITQTKAVIKYNKENARQIAVSERESIALAIQDLKKVLTNGVSIAAVQKEEIEAMVQEDIAVEEDIPGFMDIPEMTDIPEVPDIPEMTDMPEMSEIPEMPDISEIPDLPEMNDISIMEEEPELPPIEDIILEDIVLDDSIPEVAPTEETPSIGSDPNAMMTPDDIAKLIASMGQ